jgi:hypothetical protein
MKEIVNNLKVGEVAIFGRLAIKKYLDKKGNIQVKGMFLNDKQLQAVAQM